jgi:hypothetical protein
MGYIWGMSDRLSALLIAERVLPATTVRAAAARQQVYGGGLDTALLELGALSEAAVWARLSAATGLPVPPPALVDGLDVEIAPVLSPELTGPLRAVPMGESAGFLRVLCAEPVADGAIHQAAAALGLEAKLYIVPETRLLALRQRIYGETLPQRYAPLLARAMGTMKARTSFARPRLHPSSPATEAVAAFEVPADVPARATLDTMLDSALTPLERVMDLAPPLGSLPTTSIDRDVELGSELDRVAFGDSAGVPVGLDSLPLIADESGPVERSAGPTAAELLADTATEALCRRVRDRTDRGRVLALGALRRRLEHPRALTLLAELREAAAGDEPRAAQDAIETLADLRDEGAIPIFIHRLRDDAPGELTGAARRALVALTGRDFADAEQWGTWWLENAWSPRTAWLLAALGEGDEATRRHAFEELRPLSPSTFGYAPDLPPPEREAARLRWVDWWRARGGTAVPEPDAFDDLAEGPHDPVA